MVSGKGIFPFIQMLSGARCAWIRNAGAGRHNNLQSSNYSIWPYLQNCLTGKRRFTLFFAAFLTLFPVKTQSPLNIQPV